jgi:hypothetical protein
MAAVYPHAHFSATTKVANAARLPGPGPALQAFTSGFYSVTIIRFASKPDAGTVRSMVGEDWAFSACGDRFFILSESRAYQKLPH